MSMLDAQQVADRLGISRRSAYRVMREMMHITVGRGALRVHERALTDYIFSSPRCDTAPDQGDPMTREEILERALAAALTHCGDFEAPLCVHALIESALPIRSCQCDECRSDAREILVTKENP